MRILLAISAPPEITGAPSDISKIYKSEVVVMSIYHSDADIGVNGCTFNGPYT